MSVPVNPLAKLKLELKTNILMGPRGFRGLPGDKGSPGSYTIIEVGSTQTLPYGQQAFVNVDEVSPGRISLNFGIPEGPVGDGQGNVFAPNTAAENNLAAFGGDRKQLRDSGIPISSVMRRAGNFTIGRLPAINAQGQFEDSGKSASSVVVGPNNAQLNHIPVFADPTGKTLKDSGIPIGNAAGLNVGQTAGTVAAGDDSRFLDMGRNDSTFALEFADIRGQRFGMRGGYSDTFKLLDGIVLPNGGNDPNCVSLLHFEGPNGKRVVEDEAYRDVSHARPRNVWTFLGNAQLSTAQKKFGDSSLYLDSSTNTCIHGNGSNDFSFTGDYSISMWVYRLAVNIAQVLFEMRNVDTQAVIHLQITAANKVGFYYNGAFRITSTSDIPVNTWTHIELRRVGGNARLFINGISEGGTFANADAMGTLPARPVIGNSHNMGAAFNGYIDELRVHKAPTSLDNFNPPTEPYGNGSSLLKGQLYDAAAALFRPKLAGEVCFSQQGARAGTALTVTRTYRILIPASFIKKSANRIALRLRSWTNAGKEIHNMFIGHRASTGNAGDMDPATITRVTFNGQNNFVPPTTGVITMSDWIPFPLDASRDLLVCWEHATAASATLEYGTVHPSIICYYKDGALEAASAAPTGYSTVTGILPYLDLIFCKSDSKEYQDMWIDGQSVQSAAPPGIIRGAVQFTSPDLTAVPNVDFAMDVSRDDGITWVPVELFPSQIINNIYTFEGQADMSATPTGTAIKYRTRNPGGKNMPLSGVVVQGK